MLKKYEPENDSDVRSADVEDDEFNIWEMARRNSIHRYLVLETF